jgi:hypothetical protein
VWWDAADYFWNYGANADHRPGRLWHLSYARTMPGYPTMTERREES